MEVRHTSTGGHYATEEQAGTQEHMALANLAYRLNSSNVVADQEDESDTRREAKLLMSLCAFPAMPDQADLELISSSESESSYMSDSSHSRSDNFSFVCPSLSLESSSTSVLQSAYRDERRNATEADIHGSLVSLDDHSRPAALLARPLKADDRDALRLSADAMARNVMHLFRKAIGWRIDTWIHSLSKTIASKEKGMLKQGASKDDLRVLLNSPEAHLIISLRSIVDKIYVTGTHTNFNVLPHRADNDDAPRTKKRRMERSNLEEGEYQYTVAHTMMFDCRVELNTPAGYSEVTLEVPGKIEGTFLSSALDNEHLTSVSLDMNTDMLASMVEKCCRKVVRASVQASMEKSTTNNALHETTCTAPTSEQKNHTSPSELVTPPPPRTTFATPVVSSSSLPSRAAIVSPSYSQEVTYTNRNQSGFLSPIPDDFEAPPRRILPHPKTKKTTGFPITPQTPKAPITGTGASVLVSPSFNETPLSYDKKLVETGPSLPMLVEVACRAYRDH